jgi:acetyltransferase
MSNRAPSDSVPRPAAPHWPLVVRTSDGVEYRIRPIEQADAGRERDFIRRMSPQSRYSRFMHEFRDPPEALVARLVDIDQRDSMALVALLGEGAEERIIGVARYARDPGTDVCEFAVAVADDWQCRGIATTIIPELFAHAARQGFREIYGTVLASNQRMIELAEWLGMTVDPPGSGDTVRAWRRLDAVDP